MMCNFVGAGSKPALEYMVRLPAPTITLSTEILCKPFSKEKKVEYRRILAINHFQRYPTIFHHVIEKN